MGPPPGGGRPAGAAHLAQHGRPVPGSCPIQQPPVTADAAATPRSRCPRATALRSPMNSALSQLQLRCLCRGGRGCGVVRLSPLSTHRDGEAASVRQRDGSGRHDAGGAEGPDQELRRPHHPLRLSGEPPPPHCCRCRRRRLFLIVECRCGPWPVGHSAVTSCIRYQRRPLLPVVSTTGPLPSVRLICS